jgi:hypothetical protein
MKKILLISGVLLALTATVASAAGINLYWNDCSVGGSTNKAFACASNAGTNSMVLSYDPPAGLSLLVGINGILDLQSAQNPLPAWWDMFNAGTCRAAALSQNVVFPTGNCFDYWAGGGAGGITAYIPTGTNRRRIGTSFSGNEATSGPFDAGTEYYAMNVNISNVKTAGLGACAGCTDPVCVVLNELLLSQPNGTPGGSPAVTSPLTSNFVTWQGGQIAAPGCPAATPTVNRTWGQVKSIYR